MNKFINDTPPSRVIKFANLEYGQFFILTGNYNTEIVYQKGLNSPKEKSIAWPLNGVSIAGPIDIDGDLPTIPVELEVRYKIKQM